MRLASDKSPICGCYACRCGLEYACKDKPIPVVFDSGEPSILGDRARFETRFYYAEKGVR